MAGISDGQESLSKASEEYTVDYMALANATYEKETDIDIANMEQLKSIGFSPYGSYFITGIKVLSSGKLFLVHRGFPFCVLVDLTKMCAKHLNLGEQLWDCAILPDDTVAVTNPGRNAIHFISTKNDKLVLQHTVSTRSPCYGIAYRNGKLAVSFLKDEKLPTRVEVRNIEGSPYFASSFKTNNLDIQLMNPKYIAMDDDDSLFVTDITPNSEFERFPVVKYSLGGKIKEVCNKLELSAENASICCAGEAGIFMCDKNNSCIWLLSCDLRNSTVVLSGINNPQAVCYCELSGRLFVSRDNAASHLAVFSVKLQ